MNYNQKSPSLLIFAAISFVIFIWLSVYPPGGQDEQMSVETVSELSKSEVTVIAEKFIASHYDVGKLDSIVLFNSHQDVNGYLLREKVLDTYKSTWKSSIPIDYYEVLTEDKKAKLKFKTYIQTTDGRVFGWELLNPAQYAGSSHTAEAKQNILTELGYDKKDFTLVEDTTFIYYKHHQIIEEASLQINLVLKGDLITGFSPSFELPESYTTWKDRQDLLGGMWSLISLLLWFGLALAAIVYMAVYRKVMSFGRGVILAIAFLIPYLIHNINMYPGYMLGASDSVEAITLALISQLLMMIMGITVYLCFVAGDGMWRKIGWQLWPTMKDPDYGSIIVRSMGKGYLICIIVLGFQTLLFFVAGKLFDIWSTSDPLMSTHNLLSPSLYPLLAWSAAISEEAVFRMFGIIFFVYVFRSLFGSISRITGIVFLNKTIVHLIPAVIISNMIWALGHTGYSVYPVSTRFVEVSLLGFIFAYAFLRYGLITAIFAHASMDIIIMGLQIMMGDASYAFLGILYMLMPAIVAWFIYYLWRWRYSRSRST